MSLTRFNLSEDQSPPIAAKLLYVSRSVYGGDWKSIKHTHYFTEFFYVLSGKGRFWVEDEQFDVKEDDLVIVNPNIEHTELSFEDNPLEYVVLGVEGVAFDFEDQMGSDGYFMSNLQSNRIEFRFFLSALMEELNQKNEGYVRVCQSLLDVLIIKLGRNTKRTFSVVPVQKSSRECSAVKRFIDANSCEKITLEMLAEMTHLNKYYLAHAFKKYYGISPINYLIEKRILRSKELLESTSHSISQISQVAGFSSQSYFSQVFKGVCGVSPADYRKKIQSFSEDSTKI